MERQLRENGADACRSTSRRKYAVFARFGYHTVCQPFTRDNQIKKDLSSRGKARSGTRKSLFYATGKAFPDAGRASLVHQKCVFSPSESPFPVNNTQETVIEYNRDSIAEAIRRLRRLHITAFRLSKFFTSAKAHPYTGDHGCSIPKRRRSVRSQNGIRVRAPSPPP